MRKIVCQMMTTLNGRLDDPMAWIHGVGDDQYREIDRLYAGYDTILVGRTTYEEMAAYWPGALASGEGTETNRSMARRMHACRKLVFSRSAGRAASEWHNVEQVVTRSDDDLAGRLGALKAQPGADIVLSGGAGFARSVIALGLVDEFRFFLYPVVSAGATWFSHPAARRELQLLGARSYENGVVGLYYAPRRGAVTARPDSFSDLLT